MSTLEQTWASSSEPRMIFIFWSPGPFFAAPMQCLTGWLLLSPQRNQGRHGASTLEPRSIFLFLSPGWFFAANLEPRLDFSFFEPSIIICGADTKPQRSIDVFSLKNQGRCIDRASMPEPRMIFIFSFVLHWLMVTVFECFSSMHMQCLTGWLSPALKKPGRGIDIWKHQWHWHLKTSTWQHRSPGQFFELGAARMAQRGSRRHASQFDCWCFLPKKQTELFLIFFFNLHIRAHCGGGWRHASQVAWLLVFFQPPQQKAATQHHGSSTGWFWIFPFQHPVDYHQEKINRKSLPLVVASTGRQFRKKDL